MLNPFDLKGPEFLVLYFVTCSICLLIVRWVIIKNESQVSPVIPKLNLTDPYEIAYLRGGENEAAKVTVISLLDRGLLHTHSDRLQALPNALDTARRPIERAVIKKFLTEAPASAMYGDDNIFNACQGYQSSLSRLGLLANNQQVYFRSGLLVLTAILVLGLAAAKIAIALSRGHHNIWFLICIAAVFTFFLVKQFSKERTTLGDHVLEDLRQLFGGLKDRSHLIQSGGETNEMALLAAVFGISALSSTQFPAIGALFPKGTSGSSCSSCSSSYGSSCGGGSCGGGCGGCGG